MGNTRTAFRLYPSALAAGLALPVLGACALHNLHATMLDDRRIKTRHLVEGAHSLLVHYQARADGGAGFVAHAPKEQAMAV